jgi:tRNA(fMet)-specific endonuclease VapC
MTTPLFVLDTDLLTLYYQGNSAVVGNIQAQPASALAISVVTVDEQLTGWLKLTRRAWQPAEIERAYANLAREVVRLAKWRILPCSQSAMARLVYLKQLRLNVGVMDLRIAAIALEFDAVVVTRNRRDFARVPGLKIEDWSA